MAGRKKEAADLISSNAGGKKFRPPQTTIVRRRLNSEKKTFFYCPFFDRTKMYDALTDNWMAIIQYSGYHGGTRTEWVPDCETQLNRTAFFNRLISKYESKYETTFEWFPRHHFREQYN